MVNKENSKKLRHGSDKKKRLMSRQAAKRRWGATGVVQPGPPRALQGNDRKDIEELVEHWRTPTRPSSSPNLDAFFVELSCAIGRFDDWKKLMVQSRPAMVRRNLTEALAAAKKLTKRLNDLDGNSCQLLDGSTSQIRNCVADAARILTKALCLAEGYPAAGKLRQDHELYLAADVADALRAHLGVALKKQDERDLFSDILKVVMKKARGRSGGVYALARRVIRYPVKRKDPTGTVEYSPFGYT